MNADFIGVALLATAALAVVTASPTLDDFYDAEYEDYYPSTGYSYCFLSSSRVRGLLPDVVPSRSQRIPRQRRSPTHLLRLQVFSDL